MSEENVTRESTNRQMLGTTVRNVDENVQLIQEIIERDVIKEMRVQMSELFSSIKIFACMNYEFSREIYKAVDLVYNKVDDNIDKVIRKCINEDKKITDSFMFIKECLLEKSEFDDLIEESDIRSSDPDKIIEYIKQIQ